MTSPDIHEALGRIHRLPVLPSVVGLILEALYDPDASALDLGKHVAADQTLAATLLRHVNSAYYGFYRQITSVTDAIVILGFREVSNLVLCATTFRFFPRGADPYDRARLWRHSLAAAISADRIAKRLTLPTSGTFFSAGLLHDIGKVALESLYPERFCEAVRYAAKERKGLWEAESHVFGLDHAEAGGVLAEHWNLPPALAEAIRFHHRPDSATVSPPLTRVTALANHLTYEAGLGEANGPSPHVVAPELADRLGLPEDQWLHIVQEVTAARPRIDVMLGAAETESP